MSYGLPYMGSKSRLIKELGPVFPSGHTFVDLFGGGGAVTHWMMQNRSSDYVNFTYNEIQYDVACLFWDAISGKYSYENYTPEWISRADFFARKDTDAFVRLGWSFGNNAMTYLFNTTIEPYKKSMHMAVVFGIFDNLAIEVLGRSQWDVNMSIPERRLFLRQTIEQYRKTRIPQCLHRFLSPKQLKQLERLQQLKSLEQLERLERLERLEQLESLERLEIVSGDYRRVCIPNNSIVYCDIPYKKTEKYITGHFDHSAFFEWAAAQPFSVYISEYAIDYPGLTCVWEHDSMSTLSSDNNATKVTEKLYWNGK